MYQDLREKALTKLEKKKKRRREVQTVGIIFLMVAIVLFIIAMKIGGQAAFWIRLPIVVLGFVYAVVHVTEFGMPFGEPDDELSEEEIQREMVNIYRKSNMYDSADDQRLELKEIEKLKDELDMGEDFV